jgi:hypothetical protein
MSMNSISGEGLKDFRENEVKKGRRKDWEVEEEDR